jgi:hypothetical protein
MDWYEIFRIAAQECVWYFYGRNLPKKYNLGFYGEKTTFLAIFWPHLTEAVFAKNMPYVSWPDYVDANQKENWHIFA